MPGDTSRCFFPFTVPVADAIGGVVPSISTKNDDDVNHNPTTEKIEIITYTLEMKREKSSEREMTACSLQSFGSSASAFLLQLFKVKHEDNSIHLIVS